MITPAARVELESTPIVIRNRINEVFERLAKWPVVSSAKPLRGELQGSYRIRTGDYRVVFTVSSDGQKVIVWKIGNRGTVYD
jgi:mRNA interferase RelE/StbE